MNPPRILSLVAACLCLAACDRSSRHATTTSDAKAPQDAAAHADLPQTVSFNEHIQPVLSEYCYHCHGPDSGTREPKRAPLRLDRPDDAFALREDGLPVIIKGKPAQSELMRRIRSADSNIIMPPPKSHKTMKQEEIALIERWIEQGAEFEPHWSFVPVKKHTPPAAGDGWATNPIDRFIAEKLQENGLEPNPPEDPRRFYRRLHLDLTGLPPAPEAVEAFAKASTADFQTAVEKTADELLATTASAEHFARHWLDAARYADTHGIHIDNYRAIWPYRDWVINAFKTNMPWDQFTTEQLAGDMLPNRTLDQLVATGFSRCLATTGEGGAIGEEYDAIYAKDRVETVSAIWLGLTTGCASCHDHKFDPVSTKEFYQFTAFFRNTPMTPLDGNQADHPPSVFVPLPPDRERWNSLGPKIAEAEKLLIERENSSHQDFETWLATASVAPDRSIDSTLHLHLPLAETNGPLRGFLDGKPHEWPFDGERIDGAFGKAPVISTTPLDLGDFAAFSRGDQVTFGCFIHLEGKPTGAVIARMNPAESFRGWDLYLMGGQPASHVIDSWDKAANKLVAPEPLTPGKWHHVMVTFNGAKSGHEASAIFVDGKRVGAMLNPNSVGGNIAANVPLRLGSRHGGDSAINGKVAIQDFRFYRRLLGDHEIATIASSSLLRNLIAIPPHQRTAEQVKPLHQYFLSNIDPGSLELRSRIDALKTEQREIQARGSMSLIMEEKKDEPYAHILNRGVYSDKGEKVTPGTPAALPPMPADAPKNRLGLAKWLNDPTNPLPSRVTMNRTWYYLFGTGIVESNDDFGIMGSRPTHPKLLDWLAAEFVDSKWNYRHMLKLMVTSATYRQSGKTISEKLEKDPFNKLLARGPRIRLDAEPIRDLALAASGLLSPKTGGPPVKPYQPEGIWEAVAMPQSNTRTYQQDHGESLYRRSLYTMWKRTAAPPTMEIFNAPSRETFCVRRDRTNTPLQALALMNDPQFVEASRELAARAIKSSPDADARIDFITMRLMSRVLNAGERQVIRSSLADMTETYRSKPEDAGKLVTTGAKPPPQEIDPVELAAWTVVCSQLLNLDETITR